MAMWPCATCVLCCVGHVYGGGPRGGQRVTSVASSSSSSFNVNAAIGQCKSSFMLLQ